MLRTFETKAVARVYSRIRPGPPKSLIGAMADFVQKGIPDKPSLAVDVGCGGGLSTRALAAHFTNVLGTDISAAQIAQAHTDSKHLDSVRYQHFPADVIPAADNSAQLVTVCQACHFFPDKPKFFAEADRVLTPGGVLAIYGYLVGEAYRDGRPWEEMQAVISEVIELCWSVSDVTKKKVDSAQLKKMSDMMATLIQVHREVASGYADNKYCVWYPEKIRDTTSHYSDIEYHLEDILDYFRGLSPFSDKANYSDAGKEEQEHILQLAREKITAVISSASETGQADLASATVTLRFKYFLNMARKPSVNGSDVK